MRMGFDPAWHHDFAGSVDYASRLDSRVIDAHRNNLLAFNSDAPIAGTLGCDHFAFPDQDIEHELLLRIGQMWEDVQACRKYSSTRLRSCAARALRLTFDATPAARKERRMKAAQQFCGRLLRVAARV